MNRTLTKLICSAVAVMVTGSAAFAQNSSKSSAQCASPFQQGDDGLGMNQYPAAYNAPASIATKGGWDMFFDGSFIYWHADQDYMDLARSSTVSGGVATTVNPTTTLFQEVTYKPGFKVGLGLTTGFDGWVATVDYTWLHQTTTNSSPALAPATGSNTGIWLPNNSWLNAAAATSFLSSKVDSSWKMNMDLVDASVSRPFYQGKNVTVSPYGGLRALFLRQRLDIAYTINATPTTPAWTSNNLSQCWSIGPNGGLMGHWLAGCGFRFEGFAGASILYTRYTKIAHDEHTQGVGTSITGRVTQLGTLRYVADAGLGLGWGTYFSNQGYHFDLSARYDFMIAWDQNMMRQMAGLLATTAGTAHPTGDLNLHGLTATMRFDF